MDRASNSLIALTRSEELVLFHIYTKSKQCKLAAMFPAITTTDLHKTNQNTTNNNNNTTTTTTTTTTSNSERLAVMLFPGNGYFHTLSREYFVSYSFADRKAKLIAKRPLHQLLSLHSKTNQKNSNDNNDNEIVRPTTTTTTTTLFIKRDYVCISNGTEVFVFEMPLINPFQSWLIFILTNPV